jgi:hypothetical protein
MSLRRLLALAAAATLVLATAAGCSSDDDGDDADDVPTTSTTVAGGSTSTPSGQAPVELSGSVNDHGTGTVEGDDEIDLEADDFYFSPTFIQATPGQTVRVEIDNEGGATHTFTSDELQVDGRSLPTRTPASRSRCRKTAR